MSVDLGDRVEDSIIYFMWSTNAVDGSSVTRATDGTISVYKNDNLTQSVAGITDIEDVDTMTGIHLCTIDTSANIFYTANEDYTVVLTSATIDGMSVNAVLATFSIENRFMRGTNNANTVIPDAAGIVPTAAENQQQMDVSSTRLAAIESDTNELRTNQGNWLTATGFSVPNEYDNQLNLILGLTQENQYIDNTVYSTGKLTSARLRLYSDAGSVGTDSNVIATYTIVAIYTGDDMLSYSVVRV